MSDIEKNISEILAEAEASVLAVLVAAAASGDYAGIDHARDLDRVAFSELGSDFSFSAGAIVSDNVFLTETSDKLRNLGLKGTTTLRGELDYGVDLAALEKTVGDRRIRRLLKSVSDVLGDDGVPIRLSGTLKAPRLTWGASPKQKGGKGAGGLLEKIFGQ